MTEKIPGYEVSETIRKDSMRAWMVARGATGPTVLYVVRPAIQFTEARLLTGQLRSVAELGDARLVASTEVRKVPGVGYAVEYNASLADRLHLPLERAPGDAVSAGLQTLELLDKLHRANVTIGMFMPESILWVDGEAYLFDFTFDALLRENVENLIQKGKHKLSPELRDGIGKPTPQSDLWSLATYLGRLDPRIAASEWHARCTAESPAGRPASAAVAAEALRAELPDVSGIRTAVEPPPAPEAEPAPPSPEPPEEAEAEEDIGIRPGPEEPASEPPEEGTEEEAESSTSSGAVAKAGPSRSPDEIIDDHIITAQRTRSRIRLLTTVGSAALLILILLIYVLLRGLFH